MREGDYTGRENIIERSTNGRGRLDGKGKLHGIERIDGRGRLDERVRIETESW